MKIFNSHTKQKEEFKAIEDNFVKIYVCGPTVYDDAHLGHARSSISFDLLRRTLEKNRYKVTFVKNFTDIDDKIIKKMNETGKSLKDITEFYIDSYLNDMEKLNVKRADIEPKATESLDAIFNLITTLKEKNFTYEIDGDIYFDTSKDSEYCQLSHKCQEDTESRVCNFSKKNPADFALWKACKGGEDVCFESPFGKGRPGWHIECSAMIKKHIAYNNTEFQIDIHGGGTDLFFPHHENEEAQSHSAYDNHLAKYWMHNGFVNINGEKMSKSLGNSFFIKDALKIYDGEILRYYLMQTHYRDGFNFSEEDLLVSKKRLDKIYRLKKRVYGLTKFNQDKEFEKKLLETMSDDLNISKALAVIDEFISYANDGLDNNPKDKVLKQKINSNLKYISELLGVGEKEAYQYFQIGVDEETKQKIEELILKRDEAKKSKNYEEADKIREEILSFGVKIQDTATKTLWEKI